MDESLSGNQPRKHSHPSIYLFLVLPFGITQGFITVTYAYLLSHAGVSTEAVAALVGATLLPNILKFIWVPLVDITLSLKKWYVLSSIVTVASVLAMGIVPVQAASLPFLTIVVIIMNVAISFLGATCNGLAAYDIPSEKKGLVSGYLNAGNLGGSGLGGGVGLWLAAHFTQVWLSPVVLAISCGLCCFGLFFVKEPQLTVHSEDSVTTIKNVFKDVWLTIKVPMGFLAMALCFLPLSTGAAANLWAAVSDAWGASADTVALATGIVSGLITAVGSLAGGWICDRYDRKKAYIVFGVLQVMCALGMAYSPHTQLMYIIWTSLYALTLGLAYAGFSAFVFEAIGTGAAATKFTVYTSLSNTPIYYMTIIDGWAFSHFKEKAIGMLDTEAFFGVIGIVLFLVLAAVVNKRKVLPAVVKV